MSPKLCSCAPHSPLTVFESDVIDAEVLILANKGFFSECQPISGQNVSPVFTCPKKDGSHRMILNLKKLSKVLCIIFLR